MLCLVVNAMISAALRDAVFLASASTAAISTSDITSSLKLVLIEGWVEASFERPTPTRSDWSAGMLTSEASRGFHDLATNVSLSLRSIFFTA